MNLDRLLPHTIFYAEASTTFDINGDPKSLGVVKQTAARVEEFYKRFTGPDEREWETSHRIYTSVRIARDARIWCPTLGDDKNKPSDARIAKDSSGAPSLLGNQTLFLVFL